MKLRIIAIGAVVALLVSLSACAPAKTGGTASGSAHVGLSLEKVKKAGELIVGTEGTYRPFSYHADGTGALTG